MDSLSLRRILFPDSDSDEELPPKRKKVFRPNINFEFLSDREFVERFRMRASEIEVLLERIGPLIQHPTTKNRALNPEKQILIALHFLGNGCQYHGISDMHGVSTATVCRTVNRFVDAIVNNLFRSVVKWPENSLQIA